MVHRRIVSLVAALLVAAATPSFAAAPLTLDRHEQSVRRLAPPFATLPGKRLCVCQDADSSGRTFTGYLNSYRVVDGPSGRETVNMVCVYPFTNPVGVVDSGFCNIFQVIK
jgi:hypothetical protein